MRNILLFVYLLSFCTGCRSLEVAAPDLRKAQIEAIVYVLKETTPYDQLEEHYGAIFLKHISAADVQSITERFDRLPRLDTDLGNLEEKPLKDKLSGKDAILVVTIVLKRAPNRFEFRIAKVFGELSAYNYFLTVERTSAGWRVASFEEGGTS